MVEAYLFGFFLKLWVYRLFFCVDSRGLNVAIVMLPTFFSVMAKIFVGTN